MNNKRQTWPTYKKGISFRSSLAGLAMHCALEVVLVFAGIVHIFLKGLMAHGKGAHMVHGCKSLMYRTGKLTVDIMRFNEIGITISYSLHILKFKKI